MLQPAGSHSRARFSFGAAARLGALLLLTLAGGCALFGGGSESLNRASEVTVTAPRTWKEERRAESDRAYRLRSGSVATMTSSCNRSTSASLELLTRHLLMGTRNVKFHRQERLSISAGEGLHSSVDATMEGTPFNLELVVLKTDSCVFDFSLMSPKEIAADEVDEFLVFVKSLKYGKN